MRTGMDPRDGAAREVHAGRGRRASVFLGGKSERASHIGGSLSQIRAAAKRGRSHPSPTRAQSPPLQKP
eukprot:COSAG01_NODE_2048_length_8556_cov_27.174509_12_plen_69_part_00